MKHLPNMISVLRILASAALLIPPPLSVPFLLLYALCGLSDMADGYIARRTGHTSTAGAILDSAADTVFAAAALYTLLPVLALARWMLIGIAVIALLRAVSLLAGFLRYRAYAGLHTWANKGAGLLLFLYPFLVQLAGRNATACVLLGAAGIASLEELVINLTSRKLDRNVKSAFSQRL